MMVSLTKSLANSGLFCGLLLALAGFAYLSALEAAPGGATANVPPEIAAQIVQDREAPLAESVPHVATMVRTEVPVGQEVTVIDPAQPTTVQLSRVLFLGHRILPVSEPTTDENVAYSRVLLAQDVFGTEMEAVTVFLDQHPRSPWFPGVAHALAEKWRSRGYFSRAASTWKQVLDQWRVSEGRIARAYVDGALADYACYLAWSSDRDQLLALVNEMGARRLVGSAETRWSNAVSALEQMRTAPAKAFACGPGALHQLGVGPDHELVARCPATDRGTSLKQLQEATEGSKVPLRAARRDVGAPLILPSMAHWRIGHYSALRDRNGVGQVRAFDTSFAMFGQPVVEMDEAAIAEESSGAFLIPAGSSLPHGWQWMSDDEASAVWGRCGPSSQDPDAGAPNEPSMPESCSTNRRGMPSFSFRLSTIALSIQDTPLFYSVTKGPAVDFTIDYNSRISYQPLIFPYSNLGPLWTFNWLSFAELKFKPVTGLDYQILSVDVYKSRGGYDRYSDVSMVSEGSTDDGSMWSAPNSRSLAMMVVVKRANGTYYVKRRLSEDGSLQIYELPDGLTYPMRFMMTKIIDRQGHQLQIAYDQQFRVTSVTDASGQVSTFQYTATDPLLITGISDPFGRSAQFGYDGQGRLMSLTDQIGMTSTINYIGNSDQIESFTTPYGTTKFVYGGSGTQRWIEATDPMGDRERVEYRNNMSFPEAPNDVPQGMAISNSNWNYYNTYYWDKKAMRTAPGDFNNATQYRFCRDGSTVMSLIEAIKKPLQNRIWYQYPGQASTGTMSGVIIPRPSLIGTVLDDGSTQLSQATYNGLGMPVTMVDPMGRTTRVTYDETGLLPVTVSQGPESSPSILAQYSYDNRGRMLSATHVTGYRTEISYNNDGKPLTVTRPARAGHPPEILTMAYDAKGRLDTVSDPAGLVQRFTYDLQSRVKTVTDRDGYTLSYDYDAFDRVIKTTYPDGTFEQFMFNRLDLEWSRDREGRWTRAWYNANRQQVAVGDPLGRVTAFEWCRCGSLQRLWDPLGRMTSWTYDIQGRLTAKTMQDGSQQLFEYLPKSGRLAAVTDALGQVKRYAYTLDNRVSGISYLNARMPTPGVSFQYDPNFQRLLSMTDGVGTTTYGYAAIPVTASLSPVAGAGMLASVDGPFANDTTTFVYDEWSRVVERTLSGVTSSVQLDRLSRPTTITNGLGSFAVRYVGDTHRASRVTLPTSPSATVDFGYTPVAQDLRLQSITAKLGTSPISTHSYGYSPNGRIASWTQQVGSATPQVWDFGYDAADQLLRATRTTSGALTQGLGYHYDRAGNRTSSQVQTGSGIAVAGTTYNDLNQIQSSNMGGGSLRIEGFLDEPGTVTVDGKPAPVDHQHRFGIDMPAVLGNNTYTIKATDGRGNTRTSQYRIDVTTPGAPRNFTYDLNGNCTDDGQRQFSWDAENRLVRIVHGTKRTDFAYDGLSRRVKAIEYVNGVLQNETRFVWGGRSIVEERSATDQVTIRFYPQGQLNGTEKRFYLRDHLGSVREVLDASGAVRARYDYDPYGVRTKVTGDWEVSPGYTGHYHHQASGLVLSWFRAYDPALGRWISRDPLGEAGGVNLFGYVGNRPISFYDPLGLCEHDFTDMVVEWLKEQWYPGYKSPILGHDEIRQKLAQNSFAGEYMRLIWENTPASLSRAALMRAAVNEAVSGPTTKTTMRRKEPGKDGGISEVTIEKDAAGNPISKTHTVTTDGKVVHQHQEHDGKHGGERRFPDSWTGTETVNAPDHIPKLPTP